ncbi:MAG: FAD-dependent oxidoreductase, partial [Bryobacteraceae bacterium]
MIANNGKKPEPLTSREAYPTAPEAVGAVLVCGAGVTGIQASLDLAGSGFKVYLLDSSPAIGGRMAQLDKTFPTGDCSMCILSPKLVECARNKNIEIITLADVEGISGEPGNFQVKIRQNPRYVDLDKCNACGDCTAACPVDLRSEFDRGLGLRKAIFRPYPQAIPNVFGISKAAGPAPCKSACPAGVNAQGYVALVAAGKFKEAYELIRQRCTLPAACGRVCQHPCQDGCNRGEIDQAVSVRDLKRFVADYIHANPELCPPAKPPAVKLDAKVAVIGGGPAGLTVAADLALLGYRITLYDGQPRLGGMLRYGIPDYRLPEDVLDREIQYILDLGVEAKTGVRVPDPRNLLRSACAGGTACATTTGSASSSVVGQAVPPAPAAAFDAVFVAPGAWLGRKMGIPGEDAKGVWEALDFLYQVNNGRMPAIGPNVVVIGGGDVAMDAARCARRLPGVQSVRIAYRRTREEMPAHPWELAEALEEGVVLHTGLGPARIETNGGKVSGIAFHPRIGGSGETRQTQPRFDESKTTVLSA